MGQTLVRGRSSRSRSRRFALTDVNSFAQPMNVAPTTRTASRLGNRFVYDFPANSVTFIRLKPR